MKQKNKRNTAEALDIQRSPLLRQVQVHEDVVAAFDSRPGDVYKQMTQTGRKIIAQLKAEAARIGGLA